MIIASTHRCDAVVEEVVQICADVFLPINIFINGIHKGASAHVSNRSLFSTDYRQLYRREIARIAVSQWELSISGTKVE